jgi:hypothetical protein
MQQSTSQLQADSRSADKEVAGFVMKLFHFCLQVSANGLTLSQLNPIHTKQ